MEPRRSPQGPQGGIPGTNEHQAMKAVQRPTSGTASRWLDLAMALWVQDDAPQTPTRSASPPGRSTR